MRPDADEITPERKLRSGYGDFHLWVSSRAAVYDSTTDGKRLDGYRLDAALTLLDGRHGILTAERNAR
jgi:hypothetical protein